MPQRVALKALARERNGKSKPELANGSELDLALAEADRPLAATPKEGVERILSFTDSLAPTRITSRDVVASVGKSGAIVHIIQATIGPPVAFERSDEHPWSEAARLTGGRLWEASGSGSRRRTSAREKC